MKMPLLLLALGSLAGAPSKPVEIPRDPPLYLVLVWHQHQPSYLDAERDELRGPWVRTHGTKDYYDMAAALRDHPTIHVTIDLSSSLLLQLRLYIGRLVPYLDRARNRIRARAFLARWRGRTDPWVDLLLVPSERFGERERALLKGSGWSCFSVSPTTLARYPDLAALRPKPIEAFTARDLLRAKLLFALANFDPDFLRGPVRLVTGEVVDLSDLVREGPAGTFRLAREVTEDDANRLLAETAKILEAIVPAHRALAYDPASGRGRIEVVTTPFYHPILPLLADTDLAREGQPGDPLPPRFRHPEDARAQVEKGIRLFREIFGRAPRGMWPAEGAVAQAVVPIFADAGIRWIATADAVLERSRPAGLPISSAYRVAAGRGRSLAVFFRDTGLSDRVGFAYQGLPSGEAVEDFVKRALAHARPGGGAILAVILDGENAWEHYRRDADGKAFLHGLYARLADLQAEGALLTVTPAEYLEGNPRRGVPPHPVEGLPAIAHLAAGSWIGGTLSTWIGEAEENRAWALLARVRDDLAASGIARPDPLAPPPEDPKALSAWRAWEALYAAEGSDWFWWYGSDQASGADEIFDAAFTRHLRGVYRSAREAGAPIRPRPIGPIIRPPARGGRKVAVLFTCDARGIRVPDAIYIAGGDPALGAWRPNTVRMYDDGTHGDARAGDGIWSLRVGLPEGADIAYKFTNSGRPGVWVPSEEFPAANRHVRTREGLVVRDRFGVR